MRLDSAPLHFAERLYFMIWTINLQVKIKGQITQNLFPASTFMTCSDFIKALKKDDLVEISEEELELLILALDPEKMGKVKLADFYNFCSRVNHTSKGAPSLQVSTFILLAVE